MLVGDDNVMKFRGEKVVAHFRQLSDNLNLSQYFFALIETVKHILNKFYCEYLTGLDMLGPDHLAKAAFPEQL